MILYPLDPARVQGRVLGSLLVYTYGDSALYPDSAGVEFAGTLRDFVRGDLSRKYPELMADVKVSLSPSHAVNQAPLVQASLQCYAAASHLWQFPNMPCSD